MLKIIDNFIKNTDILDELYKYFHYSGSWQLDFLPHKYVFGGNYNSRTDNLICSIIKDICTYEIGFSGKGYEAWVNVLTKDINHLNHHVDCDEFAEEIAPAKNTAVIYLGDSENLEGGELAINLNAFEETTVFYNNIYDLEKNLDNSWIKVPYKFNRSVIFDSNYPHAILPIKHLAPHKSRIGLTISSWDRKIKINR